VSREFLSMNDPVYQTDFARLYRKGTENGLEIYTISILENGVYQDLYTFGVGPRGDLEDVKRLVDDLSGQV
jgi:hypothetical protein